MFGAVKFLDIHRPLKLLLGLLGLVGLLALLLFVRDVRALPAFDHEAKLRLFESFVFGSKVKDQILCSIVVLKNPRPGEPNEPK